MKGKQKEYFTKLVCALQDVLSDEDNDNHIDLSEEDADATAFFYVIGSLLPTYIYSQLSEEINVLDFNHLINTLIIQDGFKMED